jgi:hypothetical protein
MTKVQMIIGAIADLRMTRQIIADSTTGQAIAARAIGIRMVSRAIKDRRIAGRRGRLQTIAVRMINGAIEQQMEGRPQMLVTQSSIGAISRIRTMVAGNRKQSIGRIAE